MAASIINTNVMSLNAQRNLNKNAMGLETSIQRLSSGLRVNSARDDAAGLAVGMSLESDVRGLGVQIRNASDVISSNQTADGEAGVITDVLQRMSELSVQAQGTNGAANISKIQVEYNALNVFQNSLTGGTTIAGALGAVSQSAIGTSLDTLASTRAGYGAAIAVAEFNIQNFEVARENAAAARSRIMDTDFAAETANLARGQILAQAGTAMVAQANQIPSNVLSLLR